MGYFNSDFLKAGELGSFLPTKDVANELLDIMRKSYILGPRLDYSSMDVKKTLFWALDPPTLPRHFDKVIMLRGELYPSIHDVLENKFLKTRAIIKDVRGENHYSLIRCKTPSMAETLTIKIIEQIGCYGYKPEINNEWVSVKTPITSLPVILRNAGYFPLYLKNQENFVEMVCGTCKEIRTSKLKDVFSYYKKLAKDRFGKEFKYPEIKAETQSNFFFPSDGYIKKDGEFMEFIHEEKPTLNQTSIYQVLRTLQVKGMLKCLTDHCLTQFLSDYLHIPQSTIKNYCYITKGESYQEKLIKYCSKTVEFKYD